MRNILLLMLTVLGGGAVAQYPTADFAAPSSACIGQNLYMENLSTGAEDYEWDFCQGDLELPPGGVLVKSLGGNITTGVDIVFDGTNWFGFVTSQESHSLLRLDFGTDPRAIPAVTDLGTIGGVINRPTDVKVVQDIDGNWYAFVYCISTSVIVRVNFGSSLTNTTVSPTPITAEVVVAASGDGNAGFDMIRDGSEWILVYSNAASYSVVRLTTLTAIPAAGDIIPGIASAFGSGLGDLVLVKNGTDFYGYGVAWGNRVLQKLSFGTTVFSVPTFENLSAFLPGSASPYGIDAGVDNGNTYIFVSTIDGQLLRVDLGFDLTAAPIGSDNLGALGVISNSLKFRLVKEGTVWTGFATDWASTQFYRINFNAPAACPSLLTSSADESPQLSFDTPGTRHITLRARTGGRFDEIHNAVVVNNTLAPDITFDHEKVCVDEGVDFTTSSSWGSIIAYDWDFGDMQLGSGAQVSHTFGTTGEFDVSVTVTDDNGCLNQLIHPVKIYPQPVAGFVLPTASLFCTNNEFTFVNTTPDEFDGNLTYQWLVNNVEVGTSKDLVHAFLSTGDQDLQLVASIPGCSDEVTQSMTGVQSGPVGAFTFSGNCEGDEIVFLNTSSGDITDFSWDFGDGRTSDELHPVIEYNTPGTFDVTLSVEGGNGCVTIQKEEVIINTLPQPQFTLDLPPFSCAGTPSQFHDTTPAPGDSNLQSWSWDFGDGGTGNGKNPMHEYASAGAFDVTLSVKTDKGCEAATQQQVTIAASPSTQFAIGSACANQPTSFNAIESNVQSWQWKINNTNYNISNPVHVFIASGTYNVQLTKTGTNDCVTSFTRQVIVPEVPDINFTETNPCEGQETFFEQNVESANDPPVGYSWTLPGGVTAIGSGTSMVFANTGTFPVSLRTITASGCAYSLTRNVSIFESPVALFEATPSNGTPPLNVQFANQSQNAQSYLWSFNDVNNGTSTETQPLYTFEELGEYIVELEAISANGCRDIVSRPINVIIPYTEIELASLELVQSASSGWRILLEVKNNSNYPVSSFDAVLDLGAGTRLSEKLTGEILPGASESFILSNQLLRVASSGYVCIELVMPSDDRLSNNTRCLPLGNNATIFDSYPNPAKDFVNISLVAAKDGDVEIVILNSLGAEVYRKMVSASEGLNVFTVDLSYFDTGIYIAVVRSGSITNTSRILVE